MRKPWPTGGYRAKKKNESLRVGRGPCLFTDLVSTPDTLRLLQTILWTRTNKTGTLSSNFDVLLTVHLNIFISVFNELDAQNLFHNKFYFMPLHVSSTCAHHQEVKIALHSLWYYHTYRCDDTRGCVMQF